MKFLKKIQEKYKYHKFELKDNILFIDNEESKIRWCYQDDKILNKNNKNDLEIELFKDICKEIDKILKNK
jgi:hypothetical protein